MIEGGVTTNDRQKIISKHRLFGGNGYAYQRSKGSKGFVGGGYTVKRYQK
jgi:hypothetical protein